MLDMISIFLNLLKFALRPSMWSILESVPCAKNLNNNAGQTHQNTLVTSSLGRSFVSTYTPMGHESHPLSSFVIFFSLNVICSFGKVHHSYTYLCVSLWLHMNILILLSTSMLASLHTAIGWVSRGYGPGPSTAPFSKWLNKVPRELLYSLWKHFPPLRGLIPLLLPSVTMPWG